MKANLGQDSSKKIFSLSVDGMSSEVTFFKVSGIFSKCGSKLVQENVFKY